MQVFQDSIRWSCGIKCTSCFAFFPKLYCIKNWKIPFCAVFYFKIIISVFLKRKDFRITHRQKSRKSLNISILTVFRSFWKFFTFWLTYSGSNSSSKKPPLMEMINLGVFSMSKIFFNFCPTFTFSTKSSLNSVSSHSLKY